MQTNSSSCPETGTGSGSGSGSKREHTVLEYADFLQSVKTHVPHEYRIPLTHNSVKNLDGSYTLKLDCSLGGLYLSQICFSFTSDVLNRGDGIVYGLQIGGEIIHESDHGLTQNILPDNTILPCQSNQVFLLIRFAHDLSQLMNDLLIFKTEEAIFSKNQSENIQHSIVNIPFVPTPKDSYQLTYENAILSVKRHTPHTPCSRVVATWNDIPDTEVSNHHFLHQIVLNPNNIPVAKLKYLWFSLYCLVYPETILI